MKKKINVIKEFNEIPYGRYRFDAPGCEKTSGEIFREQFIRPILEDLTLEKLIIDFSDESLYGRSFLSEAIGGLIRKAYITKDEMAKKVEFIYPKETNQVQILVELSISESIYNSEPIGYEPDPTRNGTTNL
ncbi:STAS-like domain-containing protein [Photobacterium phosphoreum]|uniref:STAS-like domain-containing protein n=1 Tax=Photobacterium phosphoreum TaxID=659 RepID=UPI0015E68D34|nr:STAS-like domain-containing protein [Photobacterium phosphoreum]